MTVKEAIREPSDRPCAECMWQHPRPINPGVYRCIERATYIGPDRDWACDRFSVNTGVKAAMMRLEVELVYNRLARQIDSGTLVGTIYDPRIPERSKKERERMAAEIDKLFKQRTIERLAAEKALREAGCEGL